MAPASRTRRIRRQAPAVRMRDRNAKIGPVYIGISICDRLVIHKNT